MNKLILNCVFTLFICLASFSANADGSFQLFMKEVRSKTSSYPRDIYVYTPADYKKSTQRYPVLYMHDGQNLFDPSRAFLGKTWNALATLNKLIKAKLISPLIVVAIDNTPDRMNEYILERKGREYLNFIQNQIKPLIDTSFRTQKDVKSTAIMGSSLGGLISLSAGLTHSNVFGMVAALSPSIWWNNRSILSTYEDSETLPFKVYLDSGTDGGEKPQDVLALVEVLENRDYTHFLVNIQVGADHQEIYWAQRFPIALKFLFPHLNKLSE
jgi:predicted alpha/beta superfamily hydrolase